MTATRTQPLATAGEHLVVVVAHPDDETFGCGSVIARATLRGADVTVACATRGEAGERAAGAPDDEDLGSIREAELRRAAAVLGVGRVELLGYRDSGFDGEPPPGSLCAAPLAEVADAVGRLLREVDPAVVLTLDGSDGHRDHLQVGSAAREALRGADGPAPTLVEQCLPNSLLRRWLDEMRAVRPDTAYHALDPATLGRDDADITDVLDTADVLDRREAAIAEHRSQTSPFEGLSPELRRAFLATDHLARVDISGHHR